jgi:hypothetical protein
MAVAMATATPPNFAEGPLLRLYSGGIDVSADLMICREQHFL